MLRAATAIVTIAVLLTCPLICLGQAANGGDCAVPAAGCCPHCPAPVQEPGGDESEQTVPSCCLCKGAITDRPAVDWQPDELATAVVIESSAARTTVSAPAAGGRRLRESPAPHAGRMLRLEHCALTC